MSGTGRYRRNRLMALGAFQDDLCFFCDGPLVYLDPVKTYNGRDSNGGDQASFDHYLSRKRGGAGTRENTVIAHRDCNSHKGHEASPEFDEKLRLLNIKRGYGDANGVVEDHRIYSRLRPTQFGAESLESLVYLCDLANETGVEGKQLRDTINRRLQRFNMVMKGLKDIKSIDLRQKVMQMMLDEAIGQESKLEYPFDTLLNNVRVTIIKSHIREAKEAAKKAKKKRPV